jgi:hypothetical protein
MNWRRGCFRTWLVASALWVLGCSLLMWPSIESRYYLDLLSAKELMSLWCTQSLGLPDSTKAEERVFLECEKKFPERFPPSTRASLLKDENFAEQSVSVAKVVFSSGVWLWMLAPPLVVLVLGASIGWALLGFRKPNSVH